MELEEELIGGRVLGLRVIKKEEVLWKRDYKVDVPSAAMTNR